MDATHQFNKRLDTEQLQQKRDDELGQRAADAHRRLARERKEEQREEA